MYISGINHKDQQEKLCFDHLVHKGALKVGYIDTLQVNINL